MDYDKNNILISNKAVKKLILYLWYVGGKSRWAVGPNISFIDRAVN